MFKLSDPMRVVYVTLLAMSVFAAGSFMVMPRVMGRSSQRKSTKVKVDLSMIVPAMERFDKDMGRYPTEEEGLSALRTYPLLDGKRWRGPYIPYDLSTDPWGRPYIYDLTDTGSGQKYTVTSYGADGQPGGDGENADITDGN